MNPPRRAGDPDGLDFTDTRLIPKRWKRRLAILVALGTLIGSAYKWFQVREERSKDTNTAILDVADDLKAEQAAIRRLVSEAMQKAEAREKSGQRDKKEVQIQLEQMQSAMDAQHDELMRFLLEIDKRLPRKK